MFSRLVGVPALLTLLAAAAAPSEVPDASGPVVHRHPPRFVAPGTRPDEYDPVKHVTDTYNTTWTGYAVTGTAFTKVRGSSIVAPVDCASSPKSDSSEWVGIDGWTSATVEQIGTDSDCNGTTPSYYVWYEFFPNGTKVIRDVSIAPGDVFSAEVTYEGSDAYKVSITNETAGQSFNKTVTFTGTTKSGVPPRNSAESIEERDGRQLSDFVTDSFGKAFTAVKDGADTATDSTTSGVISAFGANVFASISTANGRSGGADSAVPSALSSDGSSFTVTWDSE